MSIDPTKYFKTVPKVTPLDISTVVTKEHYEQQFEYYNNLYLEYQSISYFLKNKMTEVLDYMNIITN